MFTLSSKTLAALKKTASLRKIDSLMEDGSLVIFSLCLPWVKCVCLGNTGMRYKELPAKVLYPLAGADPGRVQWHTRIPLSINHTM